MLASGAFRGGYKRSTVSLSDPVPALTGDWPTLPIPQGSQQPKGRSAEVADKRSLLVLIPEAIRRPKGGGLDVPRDTQKNSVLFRTS